MVPLDDADFEFSSLPYDSYIDPWTVVSIRHADVKYRAGRLVRSVTETIATEATGPLGVR